MPKEWTPEEREAAGKRLKEARQRKQQLKPTEQRVQDGSRWGDGIVIGQDREINDLLKWVARSIVTINMAGKKMDNKCLLCPVSRLHREPCRHEEIWRLAGK